MSSKTYLSTYTDTAGRKVWQAIHQECAVGPVRLTRAEAEDDLQRRQLTATRVWDGDEGAFTVLVPA